MCTAQDGRSHHVGQGDAAVTRRLPRGWRTGVAAVCALTAAGLGASAQAEPPWSTVLPIPSETKPIPPQTGIAKPPAIKPAAARPAAAKAAAAKPAAAKPAAARADANKPAGGTDAPMAAPAGPAPLAATSTVQRVWPAAEMQNANHDTYGRVVFNLPPGVTADASERDGQIVVRLRGAMLVPDTAPTRNVRTIETQSNSDLGSEARLGLAPHATWKPTQMPTQLVIDVFDPPGAAEHAPPAAKPLAKPQVKVAAKAGPQTRFSGPPPRFPIMPEPAAMAALPPPDPQPQADAMPPAALPLPAPQPIPQTETAAAAPQGSPAQTLHLPTPAETAAAVDPPVSVQAAPVQSVDHAPPTAETSPTPAMSPPAMSPPAMSPPAETDAAIPPTEGAVPSLPASGGPVSLLGQASGDSLALPFAPSTGAAAFRRGGETVVVFDERRPVDLSELPPDSPFAGARVQLLPAATVLRLDTSDAMALRLDHAETGWTLTRIPAAQAAATQPIHFEVVNDAVQLDAAGPSAVVSVPDPMTEGALLVGTQKEPGQGVPVRRRNPDFVLLETLQGVAVEPNSDALAMRLARSPEPGVGRRGFVLAAEGGRRIALDAQGPQAAAAVAAAKMTRRWDFPAMSTEGLRRRLQAAADAAAAVPPQARAALRMAAVQAQLALGMGAEAQGLAILAATDDARAAAAPDAASLGAVAAILAGRLDQADAIDNPALTSSDELTLWRAIYHAMLHEGSPQAAVGFAATLPLLLAYPAPLRAHLLPLAADTLVLGGELPAARRLLAAAPDDHTLDFARALLAEHEGRAADALALLDRLGHSNDRRERSRAGIRAAELRLKQGMITAGQAADTLDQLIYSWRGDGQELALRLRVAALRAQAGDTRRALAILRETGEGDLGQSWPDQRPAIHARMTEAFAAALAQDARSAMPPLDLVALVDENPDLLPTGEAGRVLAARLADRLAALDLPRRAAPVLQKLMDATPPGPARAEIGARLAATRFDQGDPGGALMALSASAAPDITPALQEARTITFARATAARGALGPASATLAALNTEAADEARATLLETAKDWPGAEAALASYVGRVVPAVGPLGDGPAQALLRYAAAAAQAGDEATLARLHEHDLPRMPPGKLSDMLRLLSETPVQNVSDLPRAAQEAALARGLPAALKSLGAPPSMMR